MSKTVIAADMINPDSPEDAKLVGATILSGDDRPNVGVVFDSLEDLQTVKSLRLPTALYKTAVAQNHPQGFSGVVRDALTAFLADEPDPASVRQALRVIQRAASRLEAA